jgi:hypothetical protein
MTNPFIHPTKKQFAAEQKRRFEHAIESDIFLVFRMMYRIERKKLVK